MRDVSAEEYKRTCAELLKADQPDGDPNLLPGDTVCVGTLYATIYDSCRADSLDSGEVLGGDNMPQYAVKFMSITGREREYWWSAKAFNKIVGLSQQRSIQVVEPKTSTDEPKPYTAEQLHVQTLNLAKVVEDTLKTTISDITEIFGRPPEVFQDSLIVKGTSEQIAAFRVHMNQKDDPGVNWAALDEASMIGYDLSYEHPGSILWSGGGNYDWGGTAPCFRATPYHNNEESIDVEVFMEGQEGVILDTKQVPMPKDKASIQEYLNRMADFIEAYNDEWLSDPVKDTEPEELAHINIAAEVQELSRDMKLRIVRLGLRSSAIMNRAEEYLEHDTFLQMSTGQVNNDNLETIAEAFLLAADK